MYYIPDGFVTVIVGVGAVLAMLGGMWMVFSRLKEKALPFDADALKALGLVLFVPALVLIVIQRKEFSGEAIAALLGTVAGYVLSHSKAA